MLVNTMDINSARGPSCGGVYVPPTIRYLTLLFNCFIIYLLFIYFIIYPFYYLSQKLSRVQQHKAIQALRFEDIPRVEFTYLVFTRMPGELP